MACRVYFNECYSTPDYWITARMVVNFGCHGWYLVDSVNMV